MINNEQNVPRQIKSIQKTVPNTKRNRETELIYLSRVTAFCLLKNYQIDYIYRAIRSVEYTRGHMVFQEGQKCEAVYVIKSGEVEIFKKEQVTGTETQQFLLNKQKYVYQMIKVLVDQTAFGEGDIQEGFYTVNARVSSHFCELYMIRVADYKRILDMEPQIKQQMEGQNMDSFEGITKYQLPSLYESAKASHVQKQEIQYQRKVDRGLTYLIPQSQGTDIIKNSHVDNTQQEIYNKSIYIYRKMLPNYKQIDMSNPLIQGQEIINDKFLLLKIIQKEYTRKSYQQSPKVKPQSRQNPYIVDTMLKKFFRSQRKQCSLPPDLSHREKMKIIQDVSPCSLSFRQQDMSRSNIQASPLFDIQDPLRQKQFIPTELFPIYCHLVKPETQL